MKRQARALKSLAETDWDYEKEIIKTTYITTSRSLIEYSGAAWLPWLLKTSIETLERSQKYVGRAIMGQLMTTSTEAILAEANLLSTKTRITQVSTIALEKSLRQTNTNSRFEVAVKNIPQQTTKFSWRSKATEVWKKVFEEQTLLKLPALLPPWLDFGAHRILH